MRQSELALKRWVRSKIDGWTDTHEPARGGGFGFPDLSVLVTVPDRTTRLVPVELKVGRDRVNALEVSFRPTQVRWHSKFRQAGGISFALIGVEDSVGGWQIYLAPSEAITKAKVITNYWAVGRHYIKREITKHVVDLESDQRLRAQREQASR